MAWRKPKLNTEHVLIKTLTQATELIIAHDVANLRQLAVVMDLAARKNEIRNKVREQILNAMDR
jgi:hypothetical protein